MQQAQHETRRLAQLLERGSKKGAALDATAGGKGGASGNGRVNVHGLEPLNAAVTPEPVATPDAAAAADTPTTTATEATTAATAAGTDATANTTVVSGATSARQVIESLAAEKLLPEITDSAGTLTSYESYDSVHSPDADCAQHTRALAGKITPMQQADLGEHVLKC